MNAIIVTLRNGRRDKAACARPRASGAAGPHAAHDERSAARVRQRPVAGVATVPRFSYLVGDDVGAARLAGLSRRGGVQYIAGGSPITRLVAGWPADPAP
jgi:hypothetical protein